jgi:hypothetical protein
MPIVRAIFGISGWDEDLWFDRSDAPQDLINRSFYFSVGILIWLGDNWMNFSSICNREYEINLLLRRQIFYWVTLGTLKTSRFMAMHNTTRSSSS